MVHLHTDCTIHLISIMAASPFLPPPSPPVTSSFALPFLTSLPSAPGCPSSAPLAPAQALRLTPWLALLLPPPPASPSVPESPSSAPLALIQALHPSFHTSTSPLPCPVTTHLSLPPVMTLWLVSLFPNAALLVSSSPSPISTFPNPHPPYRGPYLRDAALSFFSTASPSPSPSSPLPSSLPRATFLRRCTALLLPCPLAPSSRFLLPPTGPEVLAQ